jgi:hypothetical protein
MNDSVLKKGTVTQTLTTINGTLYEGEVVKIIRKENGDYRVKDALGKIWYIEGSLIKIN